MTMGTAPNRETIMTFEELMSFFNQTQRYASSVMGAIGVCNDSARSLYESGGTINGFTREQTAQFVNDGPAVAGVPVTYMIITLAAAMDAYLRGICLRIMAEEKNGLPSVDDTWFSLEICEAITGLYLGSIPGHPSLIKLYDAREVLNRLEFTIAWSADEAMALPEHLAGFASNFQNMLALKRRSSGGSSK